MQYQKPELKSIIRDISKKIVESSTIIRDTIELYVKSNVEIEKIKNGNPKTKDNFRKIKNQSYEFMMKKIDNQILSYLKNIQKEENTKKYLSINNEYYEKIKKWNINKIINYRLHHLFYSINDELKNQNNILRSYKRRYNILNQTKRARKEEALKNRDIGMINWQEE